MKEKTIEVKAVQKVQCYKEIKAASKSNLSLPKEEQVTPECPFGFESYQDGKCMHCRWHGEITLSKNIIGEMTELKH